MKTLIGKEGYLFLQNDSALELEVHCNNLDLVSNCSLDLYKSYNNLMLIVIPDKSVICSNYLPDIYNSQFRPGFIKYSRNLNNVYDMYPYLKDVNCFTKSDTHLNLYGSYIVYKTFIDLFNSTFKRNLKPIELDIVSKTCLDGSCLCNGDLTQPINRGDLVLPCLNETKYVATNYDVPFMYSYTVKEVNNFKILDYSLNDITPQFIGQLITWEILSKYIIYVDNYDCPSRFRTVLFHDSFLTEPQKLYMNTLSETFFVKNNINPDLINLINPNYILEFRIERFLR